MGAALRWCGYFEELSQEQIAEQIGTSQVHVGRLIATSLTQLRRHIEEKPVNPARAKSTQRGSDL
jgi:DNA-directed RNA polymerase specialized sigma24 family protein